jgi:putative transposase
MVNPGEAPLSLKKQCQLLGINYSSYYYQAKEVKEEENVLLRLRDEQYPSFINLGRRRIECIP